MDTSDNTDSNKVETEISANFLSVISSDSVLNPSNDILQVNPTNDDIESKISMDPPVTSGISRKTFIITTPESNTNLTVNPRLCEVKIDIMLDENQCGDVQKKSLQTDNYIIFDNTIVNDQPTIIFNASKNIKRKQACRRSVRKSNKYNITFKNVHFKYKNPKDNITGRLKMYYKKQRRTAIHNQRINHIYCNSTSKLVSISRVLKKVWAKENLLDDRDNTSIPDILNFNVNCYMSPNLSDATIQKSSMSYSSQDTLVNESLDSFKNDDSSDVESNKSSMDSIITKTKLFKSEILNVVVAVTTTSAAFTPLNKDSNTTNENLSYEECLNEGSSNGTFTFNDTELKFETSNDIVQDQLNDLRQFNLNEKELSTKTLSHLKKNLSATKINDSFIAQTSSELNKSSMNSDEATSSYSEPVKRSKYICNFYNTQNAFVTSSADTLLNDVINFEFYPNVTPALTVCGKDNIILNKITADRTVKNTSTDTRKKDFLNDNNTKTECFKNILLKKFNTDNIFKDKHKAIKLRNEDAIKAVLKEVEKLRVKKESEELENSSPYDLSEIWADVALIVDLTVKRLEETLVEKIINELHKSLAHLFTRNDQETEPAGVQATIDKTIYPEACVVDNKENVCTNVDENLQCDLVQNKIIDKFVDRISTNTPKHITRSEISLKAITRSKPDMNYIDILKRPVDKYVDVRKDNTVTISTATAEIVTEEKRVLQHIREICSKPLWFIRENLLVIATVPTFFIVLLSFYGVIVIFMNPY